MSVPEAAVNEDCGLVSSKDDVRLAWEVLHMKAESIAGRMKELPQLDLRLCVLALDPRHIPAAAFLRDLVCQVSPSLIASRTSAMMAAICLAR